MLTNRPLVNLKPSQRKMVDLLKMVITVPQVQDHNNRDHHLESQDLCQDRTDPQDQETVPHQALLHMVDPLQDSQEDHHLEDSLQHLAPLQCLDHLQDHT